MGQLSIIHTGTSLWQIRGGIGAVISLDKERKLNVHMTFRSVQDVFWTSYVRLIYAICSERSQILFWKYPLQQLHWETRFLILCYYKILLGKWRKTLRWSLNEDLYEEDFAKHFSMIWIYHNFFAISKQLVTILLTKCLTNLVKSSYQRKLYFLWPVQFVSFWLLIILQSWAYLTHFNQWFISIPP